MRKILITGVPNVGKTTLIRKLADDLGPYRPVGFYTAEILDKGTRRGFELVGLHGKKGVLAAVDVRSEFAVGKYGVDVVGFERFLGSIPFGEHPASPVIIDEIGKMECFSERFKALVEDVMCSERIVVATIALKGGGFIDKVKRNPAVTLFEITRTNRDALHAEVRDVLVNATARRPAARPGRPPEADPTR